MYVNLTDNEVPEDTGASCQAPRNRRYSPLTLSNAIVWDRTSPKLYKVVQKSTMFCVPTSKTLRHLISALQVGTDLNSGAINYFGMRAVKLEPGERLVNLAMDEVYTAQPVEFADAGLHEADGVLTKTVDPVYMSN